MKRIVGLAGLFTAAFCSTAFAAEGVHLDGSQLSLLWPLPFAGILLSIALFPLLAPHFWEHHFGKVAAFWAFAFLLPCAAIYGVPTTLAEVVHTAALEYLPFIILLLSLFVVSGGIRIAGNLVGNPATNTAMLAIGTLAASVVGTTGASMLLIRPMIVANKQRPRNVHVFIFFIFLVSNIGGSLTPLGDPPLFLGFLKGVDFLWTVESMFGPMMVSSVILLALFYALDSYFWIKEGRHPRDRHTLRHVDVAGLHNVLYLFGIVGSVLISGIWKPGISVPVGFGIAMPLEGVLRDVVLLVLAFLSLRTTRRNIRIENAFTWTPIQEVALLFAGIFVTIIPALAILRAGQNGHLAPLLAFVTGPDGQPINAAYFWLTGLLSSFLDNAPTYLVFFNLAGGDPQHLMAGLYKTLLAISAGAVFMGANSYIGNAPNFMVKSICEERGIKMPSFFGYMAWSGLILLPLFVLITFVFFR